MPGSGLSVTRRVSFTGPFLNGRRILGRNIELMLVDVADDMEAEVRRQIEGRAGSMPHYTGFTRSTVIGRVSSIGGKRWHRHAVVSANTAGMTRKDAIRTKAAASGIERRWHPFRRVSNRAARISRDMAKGLN